MRGAKPKFLSVPVKRPRLIGDADGEGKQVRVRNLFVMDEKHWASECNAIMNQYKIYKEQLLEWKSKGYQIIGYARKSALLSTNNETRVRCQKSMIDVLFGRSGVDMVYISPSTNSSDVIASRDRKIVNTDMPLLRQCSGNTQDMLRHLRLNSEKQIVIICLTYAGLSTNSDDLKDFLQCHKNVKYMVVDDYAMKCRFDIFERHEILQTPHILEKFKCRTSVGLRSK